MPEIVDIIEKEKARSPEHVAPETFDVEEFSTTKKYTLTYLLKDSQKVLVIYTYDKTSKAPKFIEEILIPKNIKPLTYEEKVTKSGEKVTVSNNVDLVIKKAPETVKVID